MAQKTAHYLSEIADTASHPPCQCWPKAEEAIFLLEGSAEYRFCGKTVTARSGEAVFIPSGLRHAEITCLTPSMKYLTIRVVEPEDEPCCCGEDRVG